MPPPGRLDGLLCYSVSSPELITDATPMANITSMVYYERSGLSGGAVAGIVILVLVIVAALAGMPHTVLINIIASEAVSSKSCSQNN